MKSIIYTFKDFRPVFLEADKYYTVSNQKQLDVLIEQFIDFDAVSTPAEVSFPVTLELLNGFTPKFIKANKKNMKSQLKKLQRFVDAK